MSRKGLLISRVAMGAFWIGCLALLVVRALLDISIYDEGLAVVGATRINAGEFPYRDFWTLYPPGQFWLIAGLFRLFGTTLLVVRVLYVVTVFSTLAVLFVLCRRFTGAIVAHIAVAVFLLLQGTQPGQPMPTGLFLASLSLFFVCRYSETFRARHALLAGLCAGATTVFRHDYGAYLLFAIGMAFVFLLIHHEKSWWRVAADGVIFCLGWSLIAGVALWYLLQHVPREKVIECLIDFPTKAYPTVRGKPMPSLLLLIHLSMPGEGFTTIGRWREQCEELFVFWLVPFIFLLELLSILMRPFRRLKGPWESEDTCRILLLAAGAVFFNPARLRADIEHLTPSLLFACVMGADVFWRLTHQPRHRPVGIFAGVLFLLLLIPAIDAGYREKSHFIADWNNTAAFLKHDLPRAKGIRISTFRGDYLRAIEYILTHADGNEPIFVGNSRHDWTFISDPMFYFLSERPSATRYHELHPGLTTTEKVQRQIIDELQQKQIRFVVLRNVEADSLPFIPPNIVGATALDDYIHQNFDTVDAFISYRVLKRKIGR